MGSNGSRVLMINNVQQHIDNFQDMGQSDDPIYGAASSVRYKGMDFNVARSQTGETPHPRSIHYLVQPDYIIFPDFVLLEDISPASLPHLLSIIQGICQMGVEGEQAGRHMGVGYNRIGHKDRWGVVGELPDEWTYQQIWNNEDESGIFFSPQQMISLSQERTTPKYDHEKADVFSLGIMLVEIIFREKMAPIYDYENYEIRLNPLLEKLQQIKEEFGEQVASLFVGMLEIEEEDRYDFQQALDIVNELIAPPPSRPSLAMLNSGSSQRGLEHSRGNRPGQAGLYSRTPKNSERGMYRNDVSPFRGRFGNAVKTNVVGADRSRKTPDRSQESRSPMRRQNARQDFQQRVSPIGRR